VRRGKKRSVSKENNSSEKKRGKQRSGRNYVDVPATTKMLGKGVNGGKDEEVQVGRSSKRQEKNRKI